MHQRSTTMVSSEIPAGTSKKQAIKINSAGIFLQDACVVHKITGSNATLC